jgi:hypothetical protein
LLIQYIGRNPQYLDAVSSLLNPRTRHAVVTRDPLNMDRWKYNIKMNLREIGWTGLIWLRIGTSGGML